MGGIKNREEKKKKNHVYSSGGGGGSKGPAVINKRNQERPCPHCDRTFKQVQRLNEHIAKQHVAKLEGEPLTDDKAAQPAAATLAAVPQKLAVMDVGSLAGYYSKKSPKLLLLEWTQAQKRQKPRYKSLPEPGGLFRCRVVLPDPKDDTKDVVTFLDAGSAAVSEEEAQQRGALAALHRVAGDRAMHSNSAGGISRPVGGAWKQAEVRKARSTAREAAAEARQHRERSKRATEARKKPAQVIMSDSQRRMVEDVLRDLRPGTSTADAASDVASSDIVSQLEGLGFSAVDASASVQAVRQAGGGEGGVPLVAALDWLCLNLPEQHLPAAFAAGASGKPVGILHHRGQGSADQPASGNSAVDLVSYGYRSEEVAEAMQQSAGNAEAALAQLYSRLTGLLMSEDAGTSASPSEEWVEERTALEAIYGEDLQILTPWHTRMRLDAGQLTLDFRIPPWQSYPEAAPIISARCGVFAPWALLQLTKKLAAEAEELLGSPMLHDLALSAPELLREILESPSPMEHVPPPDVEKEDNSALGNEGNFGGSQEQGEGAQLSQRQDQRQRPQQLDPVRESQRLLEEERQKEAAGRLRAMQEVRRKLPAFAQRAEVLDSLRRHSVLVVSGATGCGKSTQVPQYILEDAISSGQGGICNIICTQPRRISAVGLASRVSQERGDTIGNVVGYSVRLDTRASARTRLLFCTTGVLLRRLLNDPHLRGVTHVIIDEVHERSVDSDLLLLLLKDLLARRARERLEAAGHLRVVLMSATADADLFASYFADALGAKDAGSATLTIPGFTFPVWDLFLEDVLEQTGFVIGRGSRWARKGKPEKPGPDGEKAAEPSRSSIRSSNYLQQNVDEAEDAEHWESQEVAQPVAVRDVPQQYSQQTQRSLATVDESLVNYDLLEALIAHLLREQSIHGLSCFAPAGDGVGRAATDASAILVFLPGAPEIGRLVRTLQKSPVVRKAAAGQELRVLPLHGALPASQQARVFEKVGRGARKIVVATNVAETSITIDDVTCVIDTGRVKEMRYDAARGLARLEETWVSAAASAQRRGRAGRVQPGVCFRLFSRAQAAKLQAFQAPEVLRVPLEQLCLTVKATLPGASPIQSTLARLLTPPNPSAVAAAVATLRGMGALGATSESASGVNDATGPSTQEAAGSLPTLGNSEGVRGDVEGLTPLGQHLSLMPMDAKLGKALIYAAMLRCLGPVLTIVAAMGYGRPIFQSPPDRREEANAAKRELTAASTAAKSDHLAIFAAFGAWNHARLKAGRREAAEVSAKYFLSEAAMEATLAGRADYAAVLADLGFVPRDYLRALSEQGEDVTSHHSLDEFSGNARIVKAALCAGFYPSILRVEHPVAKYAETLSGAQERDADPAKLRFFDRVKGRVFMHPASVNFHVGSFPSGWLVYTDMTETSKVFVREASMVPVYSLLLFGGAIAVDHQGGLLTLDGWSAFKAPARIAVLVKELRAEVDRLLRRKIQDPSLDLSRHPAIDALHRLLVTNGF